MREVDRALARAYAPRSDGQDRAGQPPAPHFPVEPTAPTRAAALAWPETVLALERAYGDRFERLADSLRAARDRLSARNVLVTSCHRAEGRTTLVLTLARALARRPDRTLLIDADLSGPMLARLLGLRPVVGLDDVVEGGQDLAGALIEAPDDHLTILPLRAPVGRPREFLAGPAWSGLLARLRRDFDLVLLDSSPLFTGLSAVILPPSVDAAILVHHRAMTGERTIRRARAALDAGGVPLLGMAETFV